MNFEESSTATFVHALSSDLSITSCAMDQGVLDDDDAGIAGGGGQIYREDFDSDDEQEYF